MDELLKSRAESGFTAKTVVSIRKVTMWQIPSDSRKTEVQSPELGSNLSGGGIMCLAKNDVPAPP